ncbi:MAG TPA: AMP-binding protein [Caulobacteraceae bacterium]|jgi:fatty-acyl-CoA synthase|nr:AMP-binding protein [Caulobacteraceae bacterium]
MDAELSYVRGAEQPALREETIGAALDEAARRWGEREAVVSVAQDIRWTFAELAARADAVAAGLLALGLAQGERIGIWSPNNAEWVLTQFAAAKAGLILVTINPAYRASELEYTLNKVGVKALVAACRFKTSNYAEMVEALAPEIAGQAPGQLDAAALPQLRALIKIGGEPRPGWFEFDEIAGLGGAEHRAALKALAPTLRNNDAVNIQFTSGTTGLPKGATLSHRNILNNGYFLGFAIGLREGDRICLPVPLYHCFGMVMGNLSCITHGAAMVYPSEAFDPLAVLQTVEAERCTGLFGVPTMFIAALSHPEFDRFDLTSLRTGCMAGSPCPVEVMKHVIERLHMKDVTIAYGMTETSPVSFQTGLDDPIERRVSTVGRVQPHLECKIVDEHGEIVPRGVTGEFCTRGYSVMLGYWDDPERTAESIDVDGWMHSGDLATIDEAGYGNIVGRIKDMIIRGGENVYPREVEEYLYRHPKIEDVTVVGVPDAKYGEELCAWIRLKPGEAADAEEVTAFCRGQIAHYKIPRHIRFVDAFPMTVTGKVQKYLIRKQMIEELQLSVEQTA